MGNKIILYTHNAIGIDNHKRRIPQKIVQLRCNRRLFKKLHSSGYPYISKCIQIYT